MRQGRSRKRARHGEEQGGVAELWAVKVRETDRQTETETTGRNREKGRARGRKDSELEAVGLKETGGGLHPPLPGGPRHHS